MLGRMCLFACGYFVSIILARGLGPVEYGIYGVIFSVLVWLEHVGDFGIPEAASKLIPEDQERASTIENTAQTLLLIVFLAFFALSWLAAPAFAHLFQIPDGASLFRLAILDIPLTGIYFNYQGILAGRRNFGAISGGLAVYGFTKLSGILIALLIGLSVFWALIVNILGTVGALIYLVGHVSPKAFRPSFMHARTILQLAFPVGLLLLALQILSNLDLWSLKIIGSGRAEVIGMYVAALNIARVPALAFSAVNGVILPSLSMALAHQDMALVRRYVQGAGRFLWVTLLPASVLVAFTAEDLMALLFSSRYSDGGAFLALQVFALALFGVAQVFSEMMIAEGRPYLIAGVALFHIPVAMLLNFTLIPFFGPIGASASLALTAFFLATITGFQVFRRLGPLIETSTFVKVVLATALMTLASAHMPIAGALLLVKYLFLLSLYGLTLIVLGELTRDDLKLFAPWQAERA
jgi:O-antigen/teichoic acid export membrane protein